MTQETETVTTTSAGPGLIRMKDHLGEGGAETLRQGTVAEQAAARAQVVPKAKTTKAVAAKPKAKPTKAQVKVKSTKAKTTKATMAQAKAKTGKVITVLAKSNPHAAGSRRAGWFKKLKTGMTIDEAVSLGVRSIYLHRMAAKGIVKLG